MYWSHVTGHGRIARGCSECTSRSRKCTLCTSVVTFVSCFNMNPRHTHWEAVRWIFRYLKGTSELWLTYRVFNGSEKLLGYTDADGSMSEDHQVISGYAFLINGGTVTWSSKKQEV